MALAGDLESCVAGDAQRLEQVLVNILDNASKYTGNGETVSLRAEELDRGERAGTYRFIIADNGIGMKPEAGADVSGLRVLLAEDNEINRQIATEMLELFGARVETAENGREALEAARTHAPLYYDLVFMDVRTPVLNGYDATREIRGCGLERIEELPIIAMTADAFAEDARQARVAGMNGHLAKPISMEQLKRGLAKCWAWRQKNAPGARILDGSAAPPIPSVIERRPKVRRRTFGLRLSKNRLPCPKNYTKYKAFPLQQELLSKGPGSY